MPITVADIARAPRKVAKLKTISFFSDFWGVNTTLPNNMMHPNECETAQNVKIVRAQGTRIPQTREGLTQVTTTGMSATPTHLAYVPISTTNYKLGVDSSYRLYKFTGSEPNLVANQVATLEGDSTIVPFNSYAVLLDGSYVKTYDGSSVAIAYDDGSGSSGYQHDGTCNDNDSGAGKNLYSGSNTRAGCKFTSQSWDSGYTIGIRSAKFWLSKTGSPTGNITCKLYNSDGSSELATSDTILSAADLTTNATLKAFTFDGTYGMALSTSYIVAILYSGGDGSNYVTVHGSTVSSGGDFYYYDGSWHQVTTSDCNAGIKPGRPPKGSFGEVWKNRLFIKDPDNPGYVRFSNVNTVFDWSTSNAGGYVSSVDDNANAFPVYGIKAFLGDLYVFGGSSQPYLCKLTGTGPSDWSLPTLFEGVYTNQGALSSLQNDLWFVSGETVHSLIGVLQHGDVRVNQVGDPVRSTVQDNYTTACFTGYNPADGQFFVKLAGYSATLVCHTKQYRVDRQGQIKHLWTTYVFNSLTPTYFSQWTGNMYIAMTDGHIYKLDPDVVNDDGNAPSVEVKSSVIEMPFNAFHVKEYYLKLRSSSDASLVVTALKNADATDTVTATVSKSTEPIMGLMNFYADSLQVKLDTFSYTSAVQVADLLFKGKYFSRRQV